MIRFCASHPTAANLVMLFFLVIGIAAAPGMQRETFPEIPADEVEVRVPYPGASAEDIEATICRRIEDAVDDVTGIEEVRCEAREGQATAVVVMTEGAEIERLMDDVKTEVEAIDDFPDEAEAPVVRQLGRTDRVASVAVAGPMSPSDLKAYAEDLKERLQRLEAVSQVEVKGFSDHQIRIEVSALALRQYGLSVDDIANAVKRQSVDLPSGSIESTERDVLIRFADERRSPAEFRNLIVVGGTSGGEIRLGDLARITDRFEDDAEVIVFNGQRAALLEVNKTRQEDTLEVIDAVGAFLEEERGRAPPGVEFAVTEDISSIVRDRLRMLLKNGWQGLLLVLGTLSLFFSLRFSFYVALGLPVSFLGTIFAMSVIGYSFNMMTMVGLLIAIGILVDDSIVISENVAAQFRKGLSPLAAAIEGTRQVLPGVFSSFLTTVMVFTPLAYLSGEIGAVLKVLPVVLILTLTVSLIEAFLVLPNHLAHALGHGRGQNPNRFRAWVEGRVEILRNRALGRAVDAAIEWRYLFVGLVIAVFLGSVAMLAGGVLKFRSFPDLDGDVIQGRILLPQGTPLARTEEVVERIVGAIERVNEEMTPLQPDGRSLVRNVSVAFNRNVDAFEVGPHVATVSVDLLSTEIREGRTDAIMTRWRAEVGEVPDVIALKFAESVIGPGGLAIDIRLMGDDLEALKAASLDLQRWLGSYRGVLDISDDLRPGKPELRIRLREGALALGLDASTIAGQLRAAFFGRTASEVQVGAESYEIDVRLAGIDQDRLADLDYFTVTAADGRQVPLSVVAEIESGRGVGRIHRVNGRRTVTIQGEVDTGVANAAEVLSDTRERFLPDFLRRHPSVEISFEGQTKESARTGASMRTGFLIGLFGVFVLLSFQFRSYIEPLIVMVAIPLALIGVIWGHLLMGLDLTMPGLLGYVSLAGIVVNNSILLVTFLKINVAGGMAVQEAAKHASRQRFRAILLATATTVMGLLPLLTEQSLQAQVVIPIAVSLAFGLVVATVLVLLVVPALYTILDDFGLTSIEGGREAREAAPA